MGRKRSSTTRCEVQEFTDNGLRLVLAPVGVMRAGHGFFWVGLSFCVGITVITAAFLLIANSSAGTQSAGQDESMPLLVFGVLGGFWVVSLWTTLFGVSMGVRRGVIEMDGDSLRIVEKGLFRTRQISWTRGELAAIQSGPSGLTVGGSKKTGRSGAVGKSIRQLHVYLTSGRRVRLFTGRDAKELDWIASELREALGVGQKAYDGG